MQIFLVLELKVFSFFKEKISEFAKNVFTGEVPEYIYFNFIYNSYSDHFPKPGETLCGSKFSVGCGGKGANQCIMAAKLGAKVSMISSVINKLFYSFYVATGKNMLLILIYTISYNKFITCIFRAYGLTTTFIAMENSLSLLFLFIDLSI